MDINKDAAGIFVLAIFVSKDTWRLHFGNLHLYDWTRLLPFPPVAGSTCLETIFEGFDERDHHRQVQVCFGDS